jgi:hypothetical protein
MLTPVGPQVHLEGVTKRLPASLAAWHADVGHEQFDQRAGITAVHGQRVAGRELPDLFIRQQPLDVGHPIRRRRARGAEPVMQCHRPAFRQVPASGSHQTPNLWR